MPAFIFLTLGESGGGHMASIPEKARQAAPPGTPISPGVPPPGPRAHSPRQSASLGSTAQLYEACYKPITWEAAKGWREGIATGGQVHCWERGEGQER